MRLLPLLALCAACQPEEPLDPASSPPAYLVRQFYADDPTFQAGVESFWAWYQADGAARLTSEPTPEDIAGFVAPPLVQADVAALPLDAELVVGWSGGVEQIEPRAVGAADGVLSLTQLACPLRDVEALLVREDQGDVFCADWQGYARAYGSPAADFLAGWSGDLTAGALSPSPLDPAAVGDVLLLTENDVDPAPAPGWFTDLDAHDLDVHARHARVVLERVERDVSLFLSFTRGAAWTAGNDAGLVQSYELAVHIALDDQTTLRAVTTWAELAGAPVDPTTPIGRTARQLAVQRTTERLRAVCAGEVTPGVCEG